MEQDLPNKPFGEFIRTARLDAKLSTLELATAKLSISKSTLLSWEKGEVSDPSPEVVHELAALYKVPVLDMFRRLISSKYELNLDDLQNFTTDLGKFYGDPKPVIDEILRQRSQIQHAWFKLIRSDSHRKGKEGYSNAIAEMIKSDIQIRMFMPLNTENERSRIELRKKLNEEESLSQRQIDHCLHYEKDKNVLESVFGPSLVDDKNPSSTDLLVGRPFNETYFLKGKPRSIGADDLLSFWTVNIEQGTGTLLEPTKELAFREFTNLLENVW